MLGLVGRMLASGNAHGVLGNHEINLLANDAKDGSAWFFDERIASDDTRYAPYARATDPVTGEVALIGNNRTRGVELGFSGNVTDAWAVYGGYTYLDAIVVDGGFSAYAGV